MSQYQSLNGYNFSHKACVPSNRWEEAWDLLFEMHGNPSSIDGLWLYESNDNIKAIFAFKDEITRNWFLLKWQ